MKVMILGLNPRFSTLQYYYAWNFSVKWSIGLNECECTLLLMCASSDLAT